MREHCQVLLFQPKYFLYTIEIASTDVRIIVQASITMALKTLVYVALAVFCFAQMTFYVHANESTDEIKEQAEQMKAQAEQLKTQAEQLKTQAGQVKEQAMQMIEKCGVFEGVKAQIFSNGTCIGCNGSSTITDGKCTCGDGTPCIEWPMPQ
jgi:mannitol-specific phosphotransferase system IIBC component